MTVVEGAGDIPCVTAGGPDLGVLRMTVGGRNFQFVTGSAYGRLRPTVRRGWRGARRPVIWYSVPLRLVA